MSTFRYCVIAVIALSACSNEPSTVSGQVFIVTKGRENVKLALVEVIAIPEKTVLENIRAKHAEGIERTTPLIATLDSVAKAAAEASAKADADMKDFLKSHRFAPGGVSAHDRAVNAAKSAQLQKSSDAEREAKIQLNKLKADIAYYRSPTYYMDKLPTPLASSKTDADGRFTMKLPQGKYAIAASATREVLSSTESYYWLVWVDATGPERSLMLSND